jgi:hypothetical protein
VTRGEKKWYEMTTVHTIIRTPHDGSSAGILLNCREGSWNIRGTEVLDCARNLGFDQRSANEGK